MHPAGLRSIDIDIYSSGFHLQTGALNSETHGTQDGDHQRSHRGGQGQSARMAHKHPRSRLHLIIDEKMGMVKHSNIISHNFSVSISVIGGRNSQAASNYLSTIISFVSPKQTIVSS